MTRWNVRVDPAVRQDFAHAVANVGGTVVRDLRFIPWITIDLPSSVDPLNLPGVQQANPDQPLQPAAVIYPQQTITDTWHVERVGADLVHQLGVRGAGVRIAVLDLGFRGLVGHPEFEGADFELFISSDPVPFFPDHGTMVAGMLFGQGIRVRGIAPKSSYLCVQGAGISDALVGIELAMAFGASLINASWGFAPGTNSPELTEAIRAYTDSGGIWVGASGNDSLRDGVLYPASLPESLSVGATRVDDLVAGFTNSGLWPNTVDAVAPGAAVLTTTQDGYEFLGGTSLSAPIVAGCLALSMEARPEVWAVSGSITDPKYGLSLPARIVRSRELLRDTSVPLGEDRDREGYGRVSAFQLVTDDVQPPRATLEAISVSPTTVTLSVGETRQLTATGHFSDGTQKNLTSAVSWATFNASVASVVAGLVTALSIGEVMIAASADGVQSNVTTVTVVPGDPDGDMKTRVGAILVGAGLLGITAGLLTTQESQS